MEPPDPAFEHAKRQLGHCPGRKALLAERGGAEILRREYPAIEQLPTALPMVARFFGLRGLRDQHEIFDQRSVMALRHQGHDVDVIGAGDNDSAGEQLIGKGYIAAQRRHVGQVHTFQFGCAADGGALMRADQIAGGDPVLEERPDGLRMKPQHMVAFQESIHDQLPVGGDIMRPPREQVQIGHAKRGKVLAQCLRAGKIRARLRSKPDQPARFARGQLAQAIVRFLKAGKGLGAGQCQQPPVERISPGVIGAGQALAAMGIAALHQPSAPVTADVEKHMSAAIAVTGDQQRPSGAVMRNRHIALRQQRRRGQNLRQAIEQQRLLAHGMGGIGINGSGNATNSGIRAAAAVGYLASEGQLARGGCSPGKRDCCAHGG